MVDPYIVLSKDWLYQEKKKKNALKLLISALMMVVCGPQTELSCKAKGLIDPIMLHMKTLKQELRS